MLKEGDYESKRFVTRAKFWTKAKQANFAQEVRKHRRIRSSSGSRSCLDYRKDDKKVAKASSVNGYGSVQQLQPEGEGTGLHSGSRWQPHIFKGESRRKGYFGIRPRHCPKPAFSAEPWIFFRFVYFGSIFGIFRRSITKFQDKRYRFRSRLAMLGLVTAAKHRSGNVVDLLSHRIPRLQRKNEKSRISLSERFYYQRRRLSLSLPASCFFVERENLRRLSPSVDSSSRKIQFHTSARNVLANSDDLWRLIVT